MCGGPVAFADDFTKMNKDWGKRDVTAFVTPNHAFGLEAYPGRLNIRLYSSSRFAEGDICVNAFISQSHSPNDYGGLVFWARDSKNYYFLAFDESGQYAVQRIQNGKATLIMVPPVGVALPVKKGTNVANALEVSLSGSMAAIVINGVGVGRFTGEPPAGGGYIGFAVGAMKSGTTSWGFFHLVVSAVTSVSPSRYLSAAYMTVTKEKLPSPCVGELLLYDDFSSLSPGWQPVDATTKVADSLMTISAPASELNGRFYVNSNYSDFSACVLVGPSTSGTAGAVGLIFWATDTSNFYFFAVVGGNRYGVFRYVGSKASTLVPWTTTNVFNAGTNDWNELAVLVQGTAIGIAINGNVLTTVQGTPPNGGGKIGLLVDAPPNSSAAWSFSQLRIAAPPPGQKPAQAVVAPAVTFTSPAPSIPMPPSPAPPASAGASGDAGAMPPL